ncbi:MAG: gliding motility-associated C-terminal domain-containing protein [Saprospiraceae bacterium]
MRTIFIGICIIIINSLLISQSLFISSIDKIDNVHVGVKIGLFDFKTCMTQTLSLDTTNTSIGYGEWGDLAVCPDGKLYGLGHDGIYTLDLLNQTEIKLFEPSPPIRYYEKGMVCTKDTTLIFGERDVASYNINTGQVIYYGRLNSGYSIWSNLFLIDDQLWGSGNDDVLQIDLNNLANTKIKCTFPFSGFLSITQVPISCDSVAFFAFHISGDIYLMDTADCSITLYCTVPHGPRESFQGSAPTFMFMEPAPCSIGIDLDIDDISIQGIDTKDTIFCSLPAEYILTAIEMFSDKPWDSLRVWIESGPSSILLDATLPPFASVTGQNTQQLGFYPSALSDFNALENYLYGLKLTGALPGGISNLKIGFCGWADYLVTDTAFAYVTLVGRTTHAGSDTMITVCNDDPAFQLSTVLSSDATPGGIWSPALSIPGWFDPQRDLPKLYSYVIQDPICSPDTAIAAIIINAVPDFDLGSDRILCEGDSIRFLFDLPGYSIAWSNGSTNNELSITEPQSLSINITDDLGCVYTDSIDILPDISCLKDEIYIPNIFSPDGNGINDYIYISGSGAVDLFEFSIYDRWGNQLYHEKNQTIHWNGLSNRNEIIPGGVYVYKLKVQVGIQSFLKMGDITLVR